MKSIAIALIPMFAAIAAAAFVFVWSLGDTEAGGPATSMSLDMNIAGNLPTVLGEREDCVEADAGSPITLDVTIVGVPPYVDNNPMGIVDPNDDGGLVSFAYDFNFNSNYFTVTGAFQMLLLSSNGGSSLFDASDSLPDTTSPWLASVLDTGAGMPESGAGVLSRVSMSIDASTPAGSYPLTLTNHAHGAPGAFFTPSTTNNGRVAVGQSCSVAPTTPAATTPGGTATPTPTPSPSGSPGPVTATPTPSPSGSPGPVTATPTPSPSGSGGPTATPFPFAKGDNQCDNDVDAVDGLQGLRLVAGLAPVQQPGCPALGSEFASPFGDMDCDDDVDAVDTLRILQHIAAFNTNLPAGCLPIGQFYP